MKSTLIQALLSAGFKETTYPDQQGVFYAKKLPVLSIPQFAKIVVDGGSLSASDEVVVELCPHGNIQVVCTKPDSDYRKSIAADSVEGAALIAEASLVSESTGEDEEKPITFRVIEDENERMKFLPKHFGRLFMKYESVLYHLMAKFVPSYAGGQWDYIELSNGGAYARLKKDGQMDVHSPNGAVVSMSADGASLVVNCFVQGLIAEETDDDRFIQMLHSLRDYAERHHHESEGFNKIID